MKDDPVAVPARIAVIEGNITAQAVDAIVNAANRSLLGGGGVDGAIHRAAGPELLAECRDLGGCETGEARLTRGYRLPARWVIHTVGPVWRGGQDGEDQMLARCYRRCLTLAWEKGIRTVAFPSISTGAYGFPIERAAPLALAEVGSFLERSAFLERVLFVLFSSADRAVYETAMKEYCRTNSKMDMRDRG
jgi:O-acetyl-ADP-ribose deacetylase